LFDIKTWTLLWKAVKRNDFDLIEGLLKNGMDVNAENLSRWTPLHWACYYARPDIVCLLLDHGANVNAQNDIGWAPLHYACSESCHGPSVACLLLDHGADATLINKEGYMPLDLAAALPVWHCGRDDLLDLFRERLPELVLEKYCAPASGP